MCQILKRGAGGYSFRMKIVTNKPLDLMVISWNLVQGYHDNLWFQVAFSGVLFFCLFVSFLFCVGLFVWLFFVVCLFFPSLHLFLALSICCLLKVSTSRSAWTHNQSVTPWVIRLEYLTWNTNKLYYPQTKYTTNSFNCLN